MKMQEKRHPLSKFADLLASERKVLWFFLVYATIAGLILLSIPLGIQSMIGFISSGQISTSVIVLIALVLLGILISGAMQIMQLYLVEHLQQKLFVNTAFDFAYRIPRMKLESLFQQNPTELSNRFFDVVILQKGFAKLLTDFSAAILQIIFGLLLLSLYHPYFIIFGVFLMTVLLLIIRYTGPQGMESSLDESKYKYKMAHWLQEVASSSRSFKTMGQSDLAMQKTDILVSNYLESRKRHFKVLATQYFSFVGFKTLVTGGLLVMGGVLLIEQEINLGQFVASEIIIILIMTAVEKIMIKLDIVYDLLTSLEKMDQVRVVPLEKENKLQFHDIDTHEGILLHLKNLSFKYPHHRSATLQDINLKVLPGDVVGIKGGSNSGKTTLINLMLGLYADYDGIITYNGLSLKDLNRESLHNFTGNDSHERLFEGTILENVQMGRQNVSIKDVLQVIEDVGLSDFVHNLEDGIYSTLKGGNMWISQTTEQKLLVARYLVKKPSLLFLSNFDGNIKLDKKQEIMQMILKQTVRPSILFFTHDQEILNYCNRVYLMENGSFVKTNHVKKESDFDLKSI